MGIRPGDPVVCIARVVEFEGTPVARLEDFLLPSTSGVDELRASFRDSVVDYFDGCGGRPLADWSDSLLGSARADDKVGAALKVHKDVALFRLDEGFYDAEGTLLFWSRNYIVPDYFRFHMRRRIVHEASPTPRNC